MNNRIPDYFTIINLDSVGEVTKSRWIGTFKVKCVLTHMDRMALERVYTELLPPKANENASEDIKLRAATIAELSVRVIEGPEWWNASRNGQLLVDSEPLYDLMVKCNEAYKDWSNRLNQAANSEEDAILKP